MAYYKSFKHVERLDKEEVDGILKGTCYIAPKLDGTNSVAWFDDDLQEICAGSRHRQISAEEDNAGFYRWLHSEDEEALLLRHFLKLHPEIIVYGEFACGKVAHIKDYNEGTKDKFWIFDVFDTRADEYLSDPEWRRLLDAYSLLHWCVPILAILEDPTKEQLIEVAQNNKFLLDHANHAGEGIVIRNPYFRNRWGHYEIAKIVLDEYIQNQKKKKKPEIVPGEIEQSIVDIYVTESELSKAKAKIALSCGLEEFDNQNCKCIGMYLNLVFRDAVLVEVSSWVKKFKNPTVNFAELQFLTYAIARKYIGLG